MINIEFFINNVKLDFLKHVSCMGIAYEFYVQFVEICFDLYYRFFFYINKYLFIN